jgi:hypothetical protein
MPAMKALFRREAKQLGSGATLFRWELLAADGTVIDDNLATAPTVQGNEIYFVTSENVDAIETVEAVAQLAEMEHGKRLALYKIARASCSVSADLPGTDAGAAGRVRPVGGLRFAGSDPTP